MPAAFTLEELVAALAQQGMRIDRLTIDHIVIPGRADHGPFDDVVAERRGGTPSIPIHYALALWGNTLTRDGAWQLGYEGQARFDTLLEAVTFYQSVRAQALAELAAAYLADLAGDEDRGMPAPHAP